MIRRLTAILLLLAFSAQTFSQSIIVLDYYTHISSYAQHCLNKANPMMHCNGKCQMMKKLREEERKQQQEPTRKLEGKNDVVSSQSFFGSANQPPTLLRLKATDRYIMFIGHAHGPAIFHPPARG
jgi:hypothetical protein